ncbi:MAG: hypothetical protein KDD70_17620, partial [Bdellovibrionales bacterium]|nr:hypothetical protein [Bdellovibrionales bacterium]
MTQKISQFVFSVLAVSFLLPLHLLLADELPPSKEPPVTLSLVPEYVSVKPDSDFHIAAKVTMADGWHVY